MNDFSGPIDKKTAKNLLKLCRKTIPVMTLLDAYTCLLYTSPSPRDRQKSRMPSSA